MAESQQKRLDELNENGIVVIPDYPFDLDLAIDPKEIEAYKANPRPEKDFMLMSAMGNVPLCDELLPLVMEYYRGRKPRIETTLRLTYPTPREIYSSQHWHRDAWRPIVQVFLYLCDVTLENGPFCYIPGTHKGGRWSQVSWKDQLRVTDEEMEQRIPREHWLTLTAPKHTLIIADTMGYHRGMKNKTGERLALGIVYR